MNSYNFNYILEKNLPDDFPMDVIDLICLRVRVLTEQMMTGT